MLITLNQLKTSLQAMKNFVIQHIPTNVSQLTNDENYQTDTDVATAIADAVSQITGFDYEIVQELPASGEKGIIYLIQHSHDINDGYDEYIWINDGFERLGNLDIDLTDYATKSDLNDKADIINKTVSGSIVSFDDGADNVPVKDLTIQIVPVQSGSGDPSPENIRPITGWTGANVSRTGFNQWDEVWEVGGINNSSGENESGANMIRSKNYIPVVPSAQYYANFTDTGFTFYGRVYDADKNFIGTIPYFGHPAIITMPDNANYLRFFVYKSGWSPEYGTDLLININLSDSAKNGTYEPYKGNTYPISWQTEAGTVYGGTLDVTSGVLTVDKASVDMETLTWSLYSTSFFYASISTMKSGTPNTLCSIFSGGRRPDVPYFTVNGGTLRVYGTNYETVADFVSAVSGQQFVYELATPLTYQLTPTEVKTLLGQNNVLADTGDITLSYSADTKTYVDEQITTSVATKQDVLTFDSTPTPNSSNPVTSSGIKTAINNIDLTDRIAKGTGTNSVKIGDISNNVASANYAHAEGSGTTASGDQSHAEGGGTKAFNSYAHAEGSGTTASGNYSHSEGGGTTASGSGAHAEGGGTTASGDYSHSEGYTTIANHKSQHVFGEYNIADPSNANANQRGDYVEIVGNGTGANAKSNARTLDWNGNEVLAGKLTLGAGPTNNMDAATKQYVDGVLPADFSDRIAKGTGTKSVKVGDIAYITASGDYSHAEGSGTTAEGDYSHAEGLGTTAEGDYSHAEGCSTRASGMSSHSEGGECVAEGDQSHAEGEFTEATGYASHSEGFGTTASGYGAHAEGYYTVANHFAQHVFGTYNIPDPSDSESDENGTYIEIVGNGYYENKSNARTLDWSGNEILMGKLTVGANPTSNMDVVTKSYMDTAIGDASLYGTEVAVSGTNPVITGVASTRYICGEVATLQVTPPSRGIIEVVFSSGSTPTVLTLPSAVKMPEWFVIESGYTYAISIENNLYGTVMAWLT